MACPPNAGIPAELWLFIIYFLHTNELIRLRHLNAIFWSTALDLKYSTLEITLNHPKGIIKLLRFYREPFIAPRVKRLTVDKCFAHHVTKRPAWNWDLESLIPYLKNVVELALYPVHRDKITRRLLDLLVQSAPRLEMFSLYLGEDTVTSSPGMARDFARKQLSLPSLRKLNLHYHPCTRNLWQPIIRKMISDSQLLETLQVYHATPSDPLPYWDQVVSVIPVAPPQAHPRLWSVQLAGWEVLQSCGVTQFLYDYRLQLRALDVGDLTSQAIGCLSHLCVLNSLWARISTEVLYYEFIGAINRISSLRELHVYVEDVCFVPGNPSPDFPPIPTLPLLEKLSLCTPAFDLSYLHHFATNFPCLRQMGIGLMPGIGWISNSYLACGSRAQLSSESIEATRHLNYQHNKFDPFCEAVLRIPPVSALRQIDKFYVSHKFDQKLPDVIVDCFPNLIPSLLGKPNFYEDWELNIPYFF
ncbi:hypothetical protein DL96DRAFT_1630008 [Flagelloscypha sp. PMI_526]|nr:hypothetical protein DL96DRAFT_1630008 [Flagelloscypha sp. PMI_526]